ncbi:MAG: exo-alpha-sialidase [Armatimonadetes bacterium]|nr:exo-alpha-sialidase [Armatimonadota bacterium]
MLRKHTVSVKGPRLWQGIPSIERAAHGRLWCAFFSGGTHEPHPDNCLLLTTSEDDGETWEAPRTLIDPPGATRVFDPCLWHDPTGKLWLIYNQANLDRSEHSLWALTTIGSGSRSPAWSEPRPIDLAVPFAFRLNKPTVLSSGAWLLPVTWAREAPGDWFAGDRQLQGVAVSGDAGVSWALHGAVEAPAWALENMILERGDGSLLMLIRTGAGLLYQSRSTDGGVSWTASRPTEIVNPGVRFCLRRLASGRVLLINTPDPKERRTMYAYLSEADDGTEWGPGLLLDDRTAVSYPDAVEGPDGVIHMVHDCDRQGAGEILYRSFTEEDLLTL